MPKVPGRTVTGATVTGGEALVHSLIAHGVDILFGLPGVQNDYFYNALYDAGDRIRVIHTRHEQATAYMALGYALATGRPGVYNVVPGPGFLNTTAALATAYGRNAPVLCIAGQIQSDRIGRGFGLLHELPDQLGIMERLTKWAARIDSPADAPARVAEAFRQMATGRPRPVALEIPSDVLAAKGEVDLPSLDVEARMEARRDGDNSSLDVRAIDEAARLLTSAQTPAIFIGGGTLDCSAEVQALAEALDAPVAASYNARGVLDSRHPLSFSYPAGHQLWAKADVVLAVGTRLQQPLQSWGIDDKLKIIRIDIDPDEGARFAPPALNIVADSRAALSALITAVQRIGHAHTSRREEFSALQEEMQTRFATIQPQYDYMAALRDALPEDGFFVDEMTQIGYVSRYAMPFYQTRTYVSPGYQGTLGWGFATALGVKVACPDRPVLSISGDGGFLFTVQEIATAVQHRIGVVAVVFNDGAYGNVRRMQKELYGNRLIATELRNPDFVKLAESFGARGMIAATADEVRDAVCEGLETAAEGVPVLIEAPVGEMPNPRAFTFPPRVRPATE